jgi:hypothetical protein
MWLESSLPVVLFWTATSFSQMLSYICLIERSEERVPLLYLPGCGTLHVAGQQNVSQKITESSRSVESPLAFVEILQCCNILRASFLIQRLEKRKTHSNFGRSSSLERLLLPTARMAAKMDNWFLTARTNAVRPCQSRSFVQQTFRRGMLVRKSSPTRK